ncbi:MAG: AI-2E family transporter [Gammaproteobacteria bacterium]|nr:AI-2E family transporter [Gammaproteobacteria bacterium]MDP2140510.1 AI-2E family transporter [Gammaproteobacteria bacterium]MDP2348819.1 AI-2E family transporter [Gammaproteobacteria bacterium]
MKLIKFALAMVIIALIFTLLIVAQNLLLPLVIAIAFWYLINLLASGFARMRLGAITLPRPLCFLASIMTFMVTISVMFQFISGSLNDLSSVTTTYEANLRSLWDRLPFAEYLPIDGFLDNLVARLDLSAIVTTVAVSFTSLARDSLLIVIYVGFLLLEQGKFNRKLSALMGDPQKEKRMLQILSQIKGDIQKYISIKFLASATTGTLSYLVLRALGINFAEIWGLLIFLLNFIPTIGSIVATIFPSLMALAQSNDGFGLFFVTLLAIASLQILIGNIIEPRITGQSLNLSPIVILFNLALWGAIWGVPGMFLCVPLLIITTIVLAHFPKTRPIAILLSSDGRLNITED